VDSFMYFWHTSMYRRCYCDVKEKYCDRVDPVERESSVDTTLRMVESISDPLNKTVYLDSYFGSLKTVIEVKLKGLDIVCSCRKDRPRFLFNKYL